MEITLKEIISSIPSKLDQQDKDYFLELFIREFKEAINQRRDFVFPHFGKFGIRPFCFNLIEELEKSYPNVTHEEKTKRKELFRGQIDKIVRLRQEVSYENISITANKILKNVKRLDKK